jgi:hypothetical protein
MCITMLPDGRMELLRPTPHLGEVIVAEAGVVWAPADQCLAELTQEEQRLEGVLRSLETSPSSGSIFGTSSPA